MITKLKKIYLDYSGKSSPEVLQLAREVEYILENYRILNRDLMTPGGHLKAFLESSGNLCFNAGDLSIQRFKNPNWVIFSLTQISLPDIVDRYFQRLNKFFEQKGGDALEAHFFNILTLTEKLQFLASILKVMKSLAVGETHNFLQEAVMDYFSLDNLLQLVSLEDLHRGVYSNYHRNIKMIEKEEADPSF